MGERTRENGQRENTKGLGARRKGHIRQNAQTNLKYENNEGLGDSSSRLLSQDRVRSEGIVWEDILSVKREGVHR